MDNIKKLINNNKWDKIYNLIKNKKINVADEITNTNTIAHLAAINNNSKIIEYFLKNNKNVLEQSNEDGDTPIHLLASYGYIELLKNCISEYPSFLNLLNNNNENIVNLLYDDIDFIKFILKYDSDILTSDIYGENIMTKNIAKFKSKKDKHYKIIVLLLKKIKKTNSLFSYAVKLDKTELAHLFIENGYDVNKKDNHYLTPFLYAVKNKNYDLMELLISKGANINYNGPEGDYNPMIFAIESNDEKIIDILLNHNYNLNNYNRYLEIPLHYALNKSKLSNEIIAKLIYESDLNMKNIDGETPLHLLCKNHNWKNYNKIINKKQLDIFTENNIHKRPIDYLNGNHIYDFIDIVIDSYTNLIDGRINHITKCNNTKSDECKKELKKYIFKTKRSIPVVEDQMIMNNKIKLITGPKTIHGLFNSDVLHNVIYTVEMLKKYKNIGVPFQYYIRDKAINDKIIMENNDLYKTSGELIISNLIKIYTDNFYELSPYLIIWKSANSYYINKYLNIYIKKLMKPSIRFIVIKLTLVTSMDTTHANILIYDKVMNTFERFEPYGDVPYLDSDKLDQVLADLGKALFGAKYLSPKDIFGTIGFQSMSNDNKQSVKKLGDPAGYCLAWTFWYLEMRINNPDVPQNELLKKTLKNILDQKEIDRNQLFISFIRDYASILDKLKNNFMINAGVNKNNMYNYVLSNSDHKKVLNKLLFEFRNMME
ncbi:ankyrin repeat protein [Indivirus ILV1]|uniref:Ankyrin repeat protein n=1 Tax=Indivirus ILV1 TaxID=1977633 RepID=A0A1V0SDH9_9VIRU|nr:ankyrin repeat protein [Indivirus ILV1]